MIALIFSLILAAQAQATPVSTITGVIRTASGMPASGIRVAAMTRPESPAEAIASASFASLAETDENGRYRLENVPPGNYYISAGRVDLPTFYPGTLELLKGSAVSVKFSASVISNIDFVLDDASMRRPGGDVTPLLGGISALTLPVQVRMEGNAKQPIFSAFRFVTFRLTRTQDQSHLEMSLTEAIQNFPIANAAAGNEYRVSVENLPGGYIVKSIAQDGVDLQNSTLKLTAKNFAQAPVSVKDLTAPGAFKDTVQFSSNAGVTMTPVEITLATVPLQSSPTAGVHVFGRVATTGTRFLSPTGLSGILFADGSFEFRGVPPGRQVILFLLDSPDALTRTFVAAFAVGAQDVSEVLAEEVPVTPAQIRFPTRTPAPGPTPLASLRGRVTDDSSKEPVFGGRVWITGLNRAEFPIDSLGLFEIPRLLPGDYDLIIDGAHHATVLRSVTIGDEDVQIDITAKAGN